MKKFMSRSTRFLLNKLVGKKAVEDTIVRLARSVDSDLLMLAYHNMGILKWQDSHVSGEHFVIAGFLGERLKSAAPVLFDVGANVGDYAAELRQQFPSASIYAFEPNINTYQVMSRALGPLGIQHFNLGLSSQRASKTIYTYEDEITTGHASIYKEALTVLHGSQRIREIEIRTTTLDEFCQERDIGLIDFLKIDTEGHEWEVLSGAKALLAEGRIHFIQFEFNEMNIISRVFLKDFYDLLQGFSLYRLDSNRLIPLAGYSSTNEIFKFQNLLAVNDNFAADRLPPGKAGYSAPRAASRNQPDSLMRSS